LRPVDRGPIKEAVRRLLLVTLGLAALAAGCGSNADRAGSGAPTPADLAGDATQALFEEGSAHYVLDGSIEAENEDDMDFPTPITVHLEGDYSAEAMTAEGNVSFPGGNFTGGLIVGPHEFFINVLGRWFGTKEYGIVDAERELGKDDPRAAELYRDLQTGDGVRRYFDRVFVGEVGEGPETDGDATWAFEGHLNADGIAGLAAEFGEEEPTGPELEAFRQIADNVHVTLVVGRDDSLPRRFDLDVELTPEDFAALEKADSGFDEHGTVRMDFALVLSDFGKDVEYEAPEKFEPLEKAFEAFFSGMG
jgi:hypothetical protein